MIKVKIVTGQQSVKDGGHVKHGYMFRTEGGGWKKKIWIEGE